MSTNQNAREGRGASNGHNEKWQNAPLWDNVKAKKVDNVKPIDTEIKDEDDERTRARKAFTMAY